MLFIALSFFLLLC